MEGLINQIRSKEVTKWVIPNAQLKIVDRFIGVHRFPGYKYDFIKENLEHIKENLKREVSIGLFEYLQNRPDDLLVPILLEPKIRNNGLDFYDKELIIEVIICKIT